MGDGDTRSLALDRVEEALAAARETGVISYPNMRWVTSSVQTGVSSQKIQKKPTQRRPPFSIITNLKPT